MTSFNQSECFVSAEHNCDTLKFVYDISPRSSTGCPLIQKGATCPDHGFNSPKKSEKISNSLLKIPSSFCLFRPFLITITMIQIEKAIKDKSVDGVLGIRTCGHRMVGADKTTELWRLPIQIINM